MFEEKYQVKSRLKICPDCYSFNKETGEIFPPKKTDDDKYLECTNPECGDVFSIIPMFEFRFSCPDCGFECPVEDEYYQPLDDGTWNIFPYEVLEYIDDVEEKAKEKVPDNVMSMDLLVYPTAKAKEEMPEDLKSFMVVHGEAVYPRYENECRGAEGDYNWTEVHYCPHCKEEYSFWNGS